VITAMCGLAFLMPIPLLVLGIPAVLIARRDVEGKDKEPPAP